MKFLIAIVILAGLNLGLSLAKTSTISTASPGTITDPHSPSIPSSSSKTELNRQQKLNQMYPPDSIYSPWPPFHQPRPGTLPSDSENQQNFPIPNPIPANPPKPQDCLAPGIPARPENPELLPCPNPPGTVPDPNGVDSRIPTKADISK